MCKKSSLVFLIFLALPIKAKILGENIAVNPYALPGDSEAANLSLPGLRIHESNDYFGKTDKLISGGGSASVMETWKHFSTSLSLKGRFIQPILQTRNDQPLLVDKIGVYAESMETLWNLSYTHYRRNSIGWKFNLGLGYTDVGNHGLVNLYRQIHEAVDSPVNDNKFGEKLNESFRHVNYGVSAIFPIIEKVNFMLGTSVYNSRAFYEYALESSLVVSVSRNFAMSMKYMFIDQKRSNWWNLKANRQQFLLGLRLFTFWTPSLMYVTSYVKGDDYGQLYLSPISFTVPF